jgi:hypothetical protein
VSKPKQNQVNMEIKYKNYVISVFAFTDEHYEVKYRPIKEECYTFFTGLFDTREQAISAAIEEIDEECKNN